MINWKNMDTLAAYEELKAVRPVNVAAVMAGENGAERVKAYTAPMGAGMDFNYGARPVDDGILEALPCGIEVENKEDDFILEKDGVFASTAAVLFQEYPPSISWRGADRGYITSVYTAPEFRGKGYASMLLKKIIEEARARKLGNLWLLASRDGLNVYKKIGFDDKRDGYDVYMEWSED